jgi:hypothetical protein
MRPAVEFSLGRSTWSGFDGFSAWRTAFAGGGTITVSGGGRLAFRSGLLFARKGVEFPGDPETITLDYLEAPLLAEYGGVFGSRIRPLALAGIAQVSVSATTPVSSLTKTPPVPPRQWMCLPLAASEWSWADNWVLRPGTSWACAEFFKGGGGPKNRAWFVGIRWLIPHGGRPAKP